MPSHEAIVNTIIPQEIVKPIPVRTVTTRAAVKAKVVEAATIQNGNQPAINGSNPAAESATGEESIRLSPVASVLARKEQAFRQREQAFKAKENEYAALREKAEKYEQLTQKMSAKDYSEAEKLGLDYEEYVKYKLNQANGEDPNAQRIAELERQLTDLKKGQEDNTEKQYEAVKTEFRKEISTLVANNPEFSSIKHFGEEGEKAALQLIVDSWEEDDLEITAEQACRDIKNELLEMGKKFTSLPDFRQATVVEQTPPPRPSVNTLTNQMQPPSGEPKHKPLHNLSEAERYAEARRRVLARRAQQQG